MQLEFRNKIFNRPAVYGLAEDLLVMQNLPNAVNAAEYLCSMSSSASASIEIENYTKFILDNLKDYATFPKDLFWRKILQIISRLTTVEDIRLCERVAYAVEASPRRWPSGYAHGDFTFSNILYAELGRYLIDFTPSYIQTPYMDVIKLKQEYKLGWTGRFCKLPFKYNAVLHVLRENVEYDFTADTSVLEAINLLRILPYAKDADMTQLLRYNINKLL